MTGLDALLYVAVAVAQEAATYEPKTWLGLAGLFIAICIPALIAAAPGWINLWRNQQVPATVAETKESVAQVKDQVHHADRNLRDDLDRVLAGLRDIQDKQDHTNRDVRGLRDDMGQMRGELRDERETRACADSAQAQQVAAIDAAMRKLQHRLDTPRTAARSPEGES